MSVNLKEDNHKTSAKIFFATRAIAPPWDEASKNLVFRLANALSPMTPILLTYKGQAEGLMGFPAEFLDIYSKVRGRKITLRQKVQFLKTLLARDADIYHFYFTPERYSSSFMKVLKKIKTGKFLQTIATPLPEESRIASYVYGHQIVTQSDFTLQKLRNAGYENCSRIYPGIDTEKFKPGRLQGPLREKLNIRLEQKVVLYAGNYYLGCNDDLVKIIVDTLRDLKHTCFVLACRIDSSEDVTERERVRACLDREGVLDQVRFLDSVENMAELVQLSDLQIFPARKMLKKADLPLVLLESLAMEKPIIISDLAPLNEIMKYNVGALHDPGDTIQAVTEIKNLLTNDTLRRERGEKGRSMVMELFSIESYIEQYKILYNRMLHDESGDTISES